MKQILFFFCVFCFLLSCQGEEQATQSFASRSDSFSEEEKKALFPNELFLALVDKKGEDVLQAIIDENGEFLLDTNENGDTPLAIAIQFYNPEAALFIAKQLNPEHYLHQNHEGESYIYLASQKAYVDLIKFLANAFYDSKRDLFLDYEFSDLDGKTNEGERALHVAKNAVMAEALGHEYWRGPLEFPFRKFQYLENNQDQIFLHTAVRDRNADLLRWGVSQSCETKKEWEKRASYKKFFSGLWRGIQLYGKFFYLDWDDLINTQDEEGNTAVNFSAKNGFYEGIRILADCQWTDWLLKDSQGNIPLQNFLLKLDPLTPSHDPSALDMFDFLMERNTRLTFSDPSHHVNSMNYAGDSSLHIAAPMVNPYFYNQLKKYGDVEQRNSQDESPKEIFDLMELTRKQVDN